MELPIKFNTIGYFDKTSPILNLLGNLPHWRQSHVTYFVTFRTSDSLPQEKVKQWYDEKKKWLAQHPKPHDKQTQHEFNKKFSKRMHKWLDGGYGACLLKYKEPKAIVENAIRYFDEERYDLDEFVVAANHVHVLVTPKNGYTLSQIIHSWKSFTAKEIMKRTGGSGSFWQKESFDHIVRNPILLEKFRRYIRNHNV